MKNSKNSLLYKIIIFFLLITIGITLCRIKRNNERSKYSNETEIKGIINSIKTDDAKTTIELIGKEKIIVTYYNEIENFELGDTIKIEGKLEEPSNNTFFNLFNYKKYLKSKRINYIFKAKKIELVNKNIDLRYKIKNKLIKHIETYESKNYLKTFILGMNDEIEENITKSYQINGISHLFAISGMHLSLFAAILLFILERTKINKKINYIIIILFFIFFAFLTNYSPSILRALYLYILLSINKVFNLKIKSIYLILFDLTIMLLYNPFYIYNTGFIFSFAISISLIVFTDTINRFNKYIFKTFITSIISFLVSIPIQINSFFEINLLTPIINIIFVPFISFVVFPLSLITLIIKPLDKIFLMVISILEKLSLLIQNLNLSITLSQIPWYITLLYYIVIIIFINGIKNKKNIKLLPLIIIITLHTNIKYLNKNIKIISLDVGQGDSTLVELRNNKNILIDTGGNVNNKTLLNKLTTYFKSVGIKKIEALILTHGDFDHMGEAINLVENFKVEKVIFNCGEFNDLEQELIKVLDKKHIKYYSCIKELNVNKNKLYFLQTKEYDNENDNSNVIYTELSGYKFMFMGDAGVDKEKDILEKYNLSNIDVLKVGHHGSKTSSSKEFINEINPKYSIISVGKNNRYGHPNKEVLNNLGDSKVYRTDQDGSIMFKIKNNKLKIGTCSP